MSDEITIRHFDYVAHTPCFIPAARNYLRSMEAGHAMEAYSWSNRDPCYAAMLGDTCVGGMIYVIEQHAPRIYINYSFVEPEHRGKGIYKMMFSALEAKARHLKLPMINSMVSVSNGSQIRASAKVGMQPAYHRMMKSI